MGDATYIRLEISEVLSLSRTYCILILVAKIMSTVPLDFEVQLETAKNEQLF